MRFKLVLPRRYSYSATVTEPGPLLASGRDSDIFEFGPGLVLRRARDGRSLEYEAMVMEHVRAHGYPVPEVHELRAGGSEMVMDRVDGPHLLAAFASRPWRIRAFGRMLADLHKQLHAIPPPPGLHVRDDSGDALLHLDLHPLNVLVTAAGPVVIDWPNAARGRPGQDVANTWVILAVSDIPETGMKARVLRAGRALFVRAFLSHFDRADVEANVAAVVAYRDRDRNVLDNERAAMQRMADRYRPANGPPGAA
jgi:aminoglycoside phosphotransferase (APT) family kinase protein